MFDLFARLFDTSGFPPRWQCGQWTAEHGWLHVGSDAAIFGAYFAIPAVLGYFVLRRKDVPFHRVFWLFAAFILCCGIGHAIEATIFWHPWYRLSGAVKFLTAVVSWATVLALIPLVPQALALPGLARLNDELKREIASREKAEEERRKLEDQFQQTQKLESLGVLAGGIAHDFNNLLTSILGYADLASRELSASSIAREHIEEVMTGARRAAELTNQMLAYSGKGKFVVEPVNLSDLVGGMSRLLQVSISKRCVLQNRLDPAVPAVEADAQQLRQVVMNLIINAADAIGEADGVIGVTTGAIDCDRAYLSEVYLDDRLPEGRYVFLEVADTGCGMTAETKARIFDPFFTTKFTGRGLGLAAVLGIVRGHKGGIKVYSEPGRGTTFKVLFPAVAAAAVRSGARAGLTDGWQAGGTVLVVDDEEAIRKLAVRMFQAMGFEVLTAADGREGVEVFRRHADRVRLVLLDMTMPHMSGEEAFREMRRVRADMKAVLTSGYNEQTATSQFAGKGLAGFIQKPFGYDALVRVVRAVLQG